MFQAKEIAGDGIRNRAKRIHGPTKEGQNVLFLGKPFPTGKRQFAHQQMHQSLRVVFIHDAELGRETQCASIVL